MAVLERRLHRVDALAISIGAVIGVGVFLNTGLVLRGADGFAGATAVWVIVAVVCLTGAGLYADLSARVPEAGGPYAYIRVAFGRPAAFVHGWMNAGFALPVRQATAFAAVGEVLARWFPGDPRLLAGLALLVLTALNLLGVRAGAIAQFVFTSGKLATLTLVIGLALILRSIGSVDSVEGAGPIAAVPFVTAVSAAWFACLGWQDVVLLSEELLEPRRDLPVVLVGTVALTTLLYIAIHLAIYFGLGGDADAYGATPAIVVASRALGSFGSGLLSLLMLSSMLGSCAEHLMVRPRIAMALARDGMGPSVIAAVNRAGTPYGALLLHATIALVLVSINPFVKMLPLIAFSQGFLGVFETASYFVIRRKRPELPASRFHPWAPLVFILANAVLCVIAGAANLEATGYVLGVLVVISAVYAAMRPQVVAPDITEAS